MTQDNRNTEKSDEAKRPVDRESRKVKRLRITKSDKSIEETNKHQESEPTESMHSAVVKAIEKELERTEFPHTQVYASKLEAVLFQTYPSVEGSPEFSKEFVKRLRSLRSRMKMVAFYLNRHQELQASMSDSNIEELDKKVLKYLCTCSLDVLATPEERVEIDAIRKDMLEKRLTAGDLICQTCGKIGKGHLNLNLMGLDENTHWTNMFEDNMCQCAE
ncbi:hypothetical protein XU18_1954 [Perkinsela sp. CCAP 1560/4]|nr:hypothetical protein XU18_1954 [Perkinsela sp. CCAP 1560/4]|eukprot:KNH07422.1 hypothetical protein XU18_1954 [Perkinsela sp. CCAP 1560/4]